MSTHSLHVSESIFRLLKWGHPRLFPTPRSELSELQNLHKNSAVVLPKKIHNVNGPNYGMAGMA